MKEMKEFKPLIITASAGTGKTYRLAIEYVRLILKYYRVPDFRMDNILVLTFTRKATAEIKERIQEHIKLLCSKKEQDQEDRQNLIKQIKKNKTDEDSSLSQEEEGILTSANLEIMSEANLEIQSDRRLLQVMTIDSYIASIFRNIVRPMRSIGDFDIDTLAVEKRMPYLLSSLMTDELKGKVDSLLRSKVKRSLDGYSQFFASLIKNRWLYQMIFQNLNVDKLDEYIAAQEPLKKAEMQESWQSFKQSLKQVLDIIYEEAESKKDSWENYFNSDTRRLFAVFPESPKEFIQKIHDLLETPFRAMAFYDVIRKLKLYSKSKIRSTHVQSDNLNSLMIELRSQLSDYLYYSYFLDEQYNILQIWAAILKEYDKLIYRYKNMTYDDISWFTLETLFRGEPPAFPMGDEGAANEFYQFLTHRSRFILIDEFQDTSLMQFAILKPIIEEVCSGAGSKDYGGLIVVGDEKQSIFGWRGGERELLLKLKELFPSIRDSIETETLKKSYRTSPTLMCFINTIFGDEDLHKFIKKRNMNWHYDKVESAVTKTDYPSCLTFRLEQYQTGNKEPSLNAVRKAWVEEILKEEIEKDKNKSIAILCRSNSELRQMQEILDECDIKSVYQPNAELPEHHLVQPLISYLKWIAYRDWSDWLIWLRSDYLRIKPSLLKQAIDQIYLASEASIQADFSEFEPLQELYTEQPDDLGSPYSICQELVLKYLNPDKLSPRDHLNLHAFLDLCKSFELDGSTSDTSIPSFLQYLEELREQEGLKQVSIEGEDSVQLLTIHKSKGLQFDSVYVFYNLSSRGGGNRESLDWYISYQGNDFTHLDQYALSYNYGKILEYSHLKELYESKKKTELLEEMNNLYVALTRAKTSLHMLFTYISSKGWDDFKTGKEDTDNQLPTLLCNACKTWFDGPNEVNSPRLTVDNKESSSPSKGEEKPQPLEAVNEENYSRALDFAPQEAFIQTEESIAMNSKKQILESKAALLGDLRHYYLSHLSYNTASEKDLAQRKTLKRYGSILKQSQIQEVIESLKANLREHLWIFEHRWDKIYNEFSVYLNGKELRLDRLMIDTKQKEAVIVDFKSGGIYDEDQLKRYKDALQQIPAIKDAVTEVRTKYLSI